MDVTTAARQIAAESALEDPLSEFARSLVAGSSVQIRLPLRDPGQTKTHLEMLIRAATEAIMVIDRADRRDHNTLYYVRTRLRLANQKINSYRRIR